MVRDMRGAVDLATDAVIPRRTSPVNQAGHSILKMTDHLWRCVWCGREEVDADTFWSFACR